MQANRGAHVVECCLQIGRPPVPEQAPVVGVDAEDAVTNTTDEQRGQLVDEDLDVAVGQVVRSEHDYRLHVDRIAPKVTLSGEAADLAATGYWTNPGATLQATVTATDQGAGIKTLELWARDDNGERQLASRTVCQPEEPATGNRPPCPLRAQADFEIPAGTIADGSVRLEARAVEYTGRLARARENLFIDTTAPNAPRQVTVRRVLGSLATVTWERPPPPPDSSGISMYEYAVIYAGHSEIVWNRTPYQGVQLTGLPPGVDVQVLVRTIDGVGLASVAASGSASAQVVLIAGTNLQSTCSPNLTIRSRTHGHHYAVYKADGRTLDIGVKVTCNDPSKRILNSRTDGFDVDAYTGRGTGIELDRGWQTVGRSAAGKSTYGASFRLRVPDIECSPTMDGNLRYRLVGVITGYSKPEGNRPPLPSVALIQRSPSHEQRRGRCPTTAEREHDERTGWLALTKRSFATPEVPRLSEPSSFLRRVLGRRPTPQSRTWDAHHIIPARDSRASRSQALGFRCKLFPNSASNGVWLRNHSAPDGSDKWLDMPAPAQQRTYHPLTFAREYFTLLNRRVARAVDEDGECRTTGVNGIYSLMTQMQRRLIDGSFFAR